METVQLKIFNTNQEVYFDMVNNGTDIILKTRDKGKFKLTPYVEEDTKMTKKKFFEEMNKSIQDIDLDNFKEIKID